MYQFLKNNKQHEKFGGQQHYFILFYLVTLQKGINTYIQ